MNSCCLARVGRDVSDSPLLPEMDLPEQVVGVFLLDSRKESREPLAIEAKFIWEVLS